MSFFPGYCLLKHGPYHFLDSAINLFPTTTQSQALGTTETTHKKYSTLIARCANLQVLTSRWSYLTKSYLSPFTNENFYIQEFKEFYRLAPLHTTQRVKNNIYIYTAVSQKKRNGGFSVPLQVKKCHIFLHH